MAAGDSRELCRVCCERYEENLRDPVGLQCGHSFCRPCIVNLHHTQPPLHCPNCEKIDRRIHEGEQPEALPTNFLLLKFVQNLSSQRKEPSCVDECDSEYMKQKLCKEKEEYDKESKNKNEACKEIDSSDSSSDEEELKKETGKNKLEKEDVPEPESLSENDKRKISIDIAVLDREKKSSVVFQPKKFVPWVIVLLISIGGGFVSYSVIAPAILEDWGFTKKGPRKNSHAARMMSEASKGNHFLKDTLIPFLQAAGHKGFTTPTNCVLFFVGFVVFGILAVSGVSVWWYWRHHRARAQLHNDIQEQEMPLTRTTSSFT